MKKKKTYSPSELFVKLASYCAYQERCHAEVRQKLTELDCPSEDIEDIIFRLEEENFLNMERFANSFVYGHFAYKKWGKNKIRYGLKMKGVPSTLAEQAIAQIDDTQYIEVLKELIFKKCNSLSEELHEMERKQKVWQFIANKGYESSMFHQVWQELQDNA